MIIKCDIIKSIIGHHLPYLSILARTSYTGSYTNTAAAHKEIGSVANPLPRLRNRVLFL